MSIGIPIISTFEDKGIKAAIKEFQQLETNSEKLGAAAQAGAKVAAIGFAALATAGAAAGAVLFKAAQAAAEDQAAQTQLASQIKATTNASDLQIKGVQQYIDKTQFATGVADDQLRPALGRLSAATGDVTKAQGLLNLALDLSASTGKSVEAVSNALARAQEGAYGPLEKLGIGYEKGEVKARGFENVQKDLEARFAGSALAKANTYEGAMARLQITFSELQETIGYKVLPVITELVNSALRISNAFGEKGAAGGVAQLRQEIVGLGTDADGMQNTFGRIYDSVAKFVNGVMNALAIPLGAIHFMRTGDFGNYSPPKMPTWADLVKSTGGAGTTYAVTSRQAEAQFNLGTNTVTAGSGASGGVPSVSKKATEPPMLPYKSEGITNDFSQQGFGAIQGMGFGGMVGDINFNILGGDPNATVDALRDFMRNNGSIPIVTSNIY
jgi:hypothetical protein